MTNKMRVAQEADGINKGKTSEAGFTIIEVTVGIVVFIIVMGSIYGLLMVARGGRINTNQRSEILQNARIAINTMSRDAINAGVGYPYFGANIPDNRLTGLLGTPADTDTLVDVLTQVYARNGSVTINGVASDQVTFLFIDDTFNGGVSLPVDQVRGSGANVRIPAGWTNAVCTQGDIYLISGQGGSALGMMKDGTTTAEQAAGNPTKIPFATGDTLGLNIPGANSPLYLLGTAPAAGTATLVGSVQRVFFISYFIVPDVGSTTTGTLMRRVYGGTGSIVAPIYPGWVDQPLAYGIESMQFQYVLKDGTVVDIPPTDQMYLIRQVRLSVAVRSPDADPMSPIDPATGQHMPYRTTLTSTFSTRNLAYEKF